MRKYIHFLLGITLTIFGPLTVFAADTVAYTAEPNIFYEGLYIPDPARQCFASQFTPSVSGALTSITIYAEERNNPTDSLGVWLYSDASGVPGTIIEDSQNIPGSSMTSTLAPYTAVFSGSTMLSTSQAYWTVVCPTVPDTSGNTYYLVGTAAASPANMMSPSGGSWTTPFWNGPPYEQTEQLEQDVYVSGAGGGGGGGTNSMYALSLHASSSLASMIGTGPDGVVAWMWGEVGKPILGGGLLALYEVIPILVVIGIISILVFIGYRLWRMWRGN